MDKKTWPLGFHTFQVNELQATVPASISSDFNFASRSWKKDWGRLLAGTLIGTNKPRIRLVVLIKKTFFISTTKRKKKNADLLENSLYDNGKIDLLLWASI